jgi:hypothetical protein
MSSRALFGAIVIAASMLAAGCGNSPESVCKKAMALREKDNKDEKKSDDDKKKWQDDCVTEAEKQKKENPKMWECMAPCSDKETWKDFKECSRACKKDEKKDEKK